MEDNMKLLSVALARSVWLVFLNDLNPKGKKLYPSMSSFLLDTYKFSKYPNLDEDLDESKGLVFSDGEFTNANGELLTIKFTIFNFGLVAENVSSTTDTDYFLETLISQLKEDILDIEDYDSITRGRDYLSQLYFTTDKSLDLINPKMRSISEYLEKNLSYGEGARYQLATLNFWADPTQARNPLNFVIERQAAIPFNENRYFSSVPLQTHQHIEILNILEDILTNE
jgi:hypothetical protein